MFLNGLRIGFERILGLEMGSLFVFGADNGKNAIRLRLCERIACLGVPETLKNVLFFASAFRTGLLPRFGIIFGVRGAQNVIILVKFLSSVRD